MCPVGTTGAPDKCDWGKYGAIVRILLWAHNVPQASHLEQLVLLLNTQRP